MSLVISDRNSGYWDYRNAETIGGFVKVHFKVTTVLDPRITGKTGPSAAGGSPPPDDTGPPPYGKGDLMWDRTVAMAVLVDGGTAILYKLGEWRQPGKVTWTLADIDYLYRTLSDHLLGNFDGTDYAGRIQWAIVNKLISREDAEQNAPLKEQLVTREGWGEWLLGGFQGKDTAAFDRFIGDPIRAAMKQDMTFVLSGGKIEEIKIIPAEPYHPPPPPDPTNAGLGLGAILLIGGALAAFFLFGKNDKNTIRIRVTR